MSSSAAASTPAGDPGSPSAAPPIDTEALLRRCLGRADLAQRMQQRFHQQARDDAARLRAAIDGEDAAQCEAIAHRLKGSAAHVAAPAILALASQLETLARHLPLAAARGVWEELQREIARLPTPQGPEA